MARKGRPPLPDEVKKVRGTFRKDRAHPVVRVALGKAKCPTWLDSVARKEWRRVAPELERLGLLTALDQTLLAGYCSAYALWKRAMEALAEGELTYTTDTGQQKPRPEIAIARSQVDIMRALCIEFGMTPSVRGRMLLPGEPPEKEAEDPWAAMRKRSLHAI